ncbi:PTS sugar transporter subunit IIA [Planctomycetota bacterium]
MSVSSPKKQGPDTSEIKLSDYISPKSILDITAPTKQSLFESLAKAVLAQSKDVSLASILAGIQEREAAMSTYVGNGVAIPHAYIEGVDGLHLAIARNAKGFPYGVETDEPVVIVVLVVGSTAMRYNHVNVLANIAKVFVDPTRKAAIQTTADPKSVIRLLDTPGTIRQRKAPPATMALLRHALQLARQMDVTAIVATIESMAALAALQQIPRRKQFIVATSSPQIAEKCHKLIKRILLLPPISYGQHSSDKMKLCLLIAQTRGMLKKGDQVLFLASRKNKGFNSLSIETIDKRYDPLAATGQTAKGILPEVLERIITLCSELGSQGREGNPIGTLFVITANEKALAPYTQQMVMNPFLGHPEEVRNILDPTLAETIKEFAAIDGAFIVRGDGLLLSGGVFLKVDYDVKLPGGYGSRHRAAGAITHSVNCVAVTVSQSTGEVTVFKRGDVLLTLQRNINQ